MKQWLEELKEGDDVFTCHNYATLRACKVTKVTQTQIKIGNSKFRKSNGSLIGGSVWSSTVLAPFNQENIAIYKETLIHQKIRTKVCEIYDKLNSEQLKKNSSQEILDHLEEVLARITNGEEL